MYGNNSPFYCKQAIEKISQKELFGCAIDIFVAKFGVNDFLTAVNTVVTRKSIAECNSNQIIWHAGVSKQLKA